MAHTDLPLAELEHYQPNIHRPANFDEFWEKTLHDARSYDLDVVMTRQASGFVGFDTYDVTFSGWSGERVKAWFHMPINPATPPPCVVQYIGYNGGRGLPHQWTRWASAGYAHLVLDTRGQGTGTCPGDTPDTGSNGPGSGSFVTRGIQSPDSYYYRRLTVDAVRLIDVALSLDHIDRSRIAAMGTSQGGGLAVAVSGLSPAVTALIADVPFLSHIQRAVEICDTNPYGEIRQYLASHRDKVDETLQTLSYFDIANHAPRAHMPALFAVALMDSLCPPSTVYAAINNHGGPVDVRIYPYNDHEGGGAHFEREQQNWLADTWNLSLGRTDS